MNTPSFVYAGIDVSKKTLELCLQGKSLEFAHDAAGCAALIKRLHQVSQPLQVICEASGGWERPIVDALHEAAIILSVINPRQVRDFAKATGLKAKTDRIDARLLADFGLHIQPPPTPPPSAQQRELSAWVTRRDQVQAMLQAEKTRLIPGLPKTVGKDVNASIARYRQTMSRAVRLRAFVSRFTPYAGNFGNEGRFTEKKHGNESSRQTKGWKRREAFHFSAVALWRVIIHHETPGIFDEE